jgi:hypothetical protein
MECCRGLYFDNRRCQPTPSVEPTGARNENSVATAESLGALRRVEQRFGPSSHPRMWELILHTLRVVWRIFLQLFFSVEPLDPTLNNLGTASQFPLEDDSQLIQDLDYLSLSQLIGVAKLLVVNLIVKIFGVGLGPDDNWERELQVIRPVQTQAVFQTEAQSPASSTMSLGEKDVEKPSVDATSIEPAQPVNDVSHFCCGLGVADLFDFKISPFMFVIFALFHCFNLLYICIDSATSAPVGSTNWYKYQLIMFRGLNSGATVFFAISIAGVLEKAAWEFNNDETKRKELARMLATRILAFGLISLPVVLTHILPMAVLYGWITFLVLGSLFGAVVIIAATRFFCCGSADEREHHIQTLPESFRGPHMAFRRFILSFLELDSKFLATVVRVTMVLAAVFIAQTLFHYGVLYYQGEQRYLEVVATEYQMRNTACYIASISEQISKVATVIPYVSVFIV